MTDLEKEIKELEERLASLERKGQEPPDIDKIASALAKEMEAIPPLDSVFHTQSKQEQKP